MSLYLWVRLGEVLISLIWVPTNSRRLAESALSITRTAVKFIKYLVTLKSLLIAAFTFCTRSDCHLGAHQLLPGKRDFALGPHSFLAGNKVAKGGSISHLPAGIGHSPAGLPGPVTEHKQHGLVYPAPSDAGGRMHLEKVMSHSSSYPQGWSGTRCRRCSGWNLVVLANMRGTRFLCVNLQIVLRFEEIDKKANSLPTHADVVVGLLFFRAISSKPKNCVH